MTPSVIAAGATAATYNGVAVNNTAPFPPVAACRGSGASSPFASPGTQTISSPAQTTGSRPRFARGTLRSTIRSCNDFDPPSPRGRMRSPGRRGRTSSGAFAKIAGQQQMFGARLGRGVDGGGRDTPVAEDDFAGQAQRHRRRRRSVVFVALGQDDADLAVLDRQRGPLDLDRLAAAPGAGLEHAAERRTRGGSRSAGLLLDELAQDERGQRRRHAAEAGAVEPLRRRIERLLEQAVDDLADRLVLERDLVGRAQHVVDGGGMHFAQLGQRGARVGAREARIGVAGVFAPAEPLRFAPLAKLGAREVEQRPHDLAAMARHAQQRAAPRRGGQAVQNRLGAVV